MNKGDRDFVEGFVSQTKAEKNLSVVSDARCVLMKVEEGRIYTTTTAVEFWAAQHYHKQGYKLIGGFVLSKKIVGDQLRDWACPVSRYSHKHDPENERMVVYLIAKAVTSYLSGKDTDLQMWDREEMQQFNPNVVNLLMVERKEV